MNSILPTNISQCQNALKKQGFCQVKCPLPHEIIELVQLKKYDKIDETFKKLLSPSNELFSFFKNYTPYSISHIEHIISLRESENEWEEDGIWHDDGSRVLAFSLSLTITKPEGGVLEIRRKGEACSSKIVTPDYGTAIIFKTGKENYEHKINMVKKGSRLIVAGWLYEA